jgi:hypothetical protein
MSSLNDLALLALAKQLLTGPDLETLMAKFELSIRIGKFTPQHGKTNNY